MTNIKIHKSAPVGQLILNSPQTLNLIEEDTFDLISSALDEFETDEGVRVVLISAVCGVSKKSGQKVFSAGVNLKKYDQKLQLLDKNPQEFRDKLIKSRLLPAKIEQYSKPVVMGVDGLVTGGFFEVALACDAVLASDSAVFSLNEVNVGLIPGYGGIHRLARLVGRNRAFDIISSGRQINTEEAYQLGIVSSIMPEKDFIAYCYGLAGKPAVALRQIKLCLSGIEPDAEVEAFIEAVGSAEAKARIYKFLDF